jgi:hypothetical protein
LMVWRSLAFSLYIGKLRTRRDKKNRNKKARDYGR